MVQIIEAHEEVLSRGGSLADAIEAYIQHHPTATFTEVLRRFDSLANVRGSAALEIAPNTVLWIGMSEGAVDAFQTLFREKRVEMKATQLLVYMIDGGYLEMPIAKRVPVNGYKKEHWLPVCMSVAKCL